MSPQIKHRVGGAWVDGGGPTHAKIAGTFEEIAGGGTPVTYTIFGDPADAALTSQHGTYATARTGGTVTAGNVADQGADVGQNTGFTIWQHTIGFDTSAVVGTITSATLHLYGTAKGGAGFTIEARLHDWGASVTAADWVSGADLASKTLLASIAEAAYSASGYNALTSDAAFIANINQSGFTRMIVCSSKQRLGIQPSGLEYASFATANVDGTGQDPKLVIEALV
jgi:hypothetical protein